MSRHGLKRIKKAMPVKNKAPRATPWAVIAIALVGSAISFKISWTLPIIAAFGGIVVYRGLLIEKRAAEALEKMHQEPSRVRAIRHIENVGWGILMAGILAEIITASVLAVRDIYEEEITTKHLQSIDPMNQPISTVEAQAFVIEYGTKESGFSPTEFGRIHLTIGVGSDTNFWRPNMTWNLSCFNCQKMNEENDPKRTDLGWIMSFKSEYMFLPLSGKVRDAAKWDTVKLDIWPLPADSVVLGGHLTVFVNQTNFSFNIPIQAVKRSADMAAFCKNPPKGVTVFTW